MTQDVTARSVARVAFAEALAALEPRALVARAAACWRPGRPLELLAVGKAAAAMAAGVADVCELAGGLVVCRDAGGALPARLERRLAGHPVPDARSLTAGSELLERAARADVLLVSGGASALAALPAWELSLADKVAATSAVAASGAGIHALNAVRKHLSRIKGGRLGAAARRPLRVLVLSDVVGDDLSTVGGGLARPDPTTFADALDVVGGLEVPAAVRAALERGARGQLEETPKPGDPHLAGVETCLVAGPDDLASAVAAALARRGYVVEMETRVTDAVEALAERLVRAARRLAPGHAFVAGGEPVIRVPPGAGRGGRAQHTALLCARGIAGLAGEAVILCVGSDGTDGPTEDAGGLVDPGTWARAGDAEAALERFDSGRALATAGALVTTGPTGTNLADVYLAVAGSGVPFTTSELPKPAGLS